MKIENRKVIDVNGVKILRITTTDERWYQVGESFLPSVTWICSYYPKTVRYMKWLAQQGWDEAETIRREAGEKGSRVHNACADALQGHEIKFDGKYSANDGEEPKELTPEEYSAVISFVDFLEKHQPQIMGFDYTLTNSEYGFAGTVDFKCRLNIDEYKDVWIVDIKTSKDIWPSHEIQVSAYKACDPEVTKIAILQVGYERNKNQKFKFTEVKDKFKLFLSTKDTWENETEGVMPHQKDYPLVVQWKPTKK